MKARRELPFKVRLNSSLVPARLLSFCTISGTVLDNFQINWSLLHPDGVDFMGEGLFGPQQFGPSSYFDLFVFDPDNSPFEIHSPGPLQVQPLYRGHILKLGVSWTGVPGSPEPGKAILIWSSDEFSADRAPRLALGSQVAAVDRFTEMFDRQLSSEVLGIRRRVRRMNRLDVLGRRRRERRMRALVQNTDVPQYVESISVTGFRGFRTKGVLTLAHPNGEAGSGLTIVVGANNAGKSTLWESFEAVARKRKGEVSFSEGQRNKGSANGVRIELSYADGSIYSLWSSDPDSSETVSGWSPESSLHPPELKTVVLPSRRYFRASFHRSGSVQEDWMVGGGMGFTRFQERDSFTGRLFKLHEDKVRKKRFDDLLKRVVGYEVDWKIELADNQNGPSFYLKVKVSDGIHHSSEGLGDGIISLIFILDALYETDSNALLVIDEPELSLHPQLVRRLQKEFSRVSANRQVVIFTHSPQMVSWEDIEAGAEIARVYKEGPDSLISQPTRNVIEDVSITRKGWNNPHVLGSDANEALFLDDKIIVVEGQEDAALLPVVFRQADVEQRGTVFGWGSGGGDVNPRRIVGLLDGLGFKKVVALLDGNKPDEVEAIRETFPHYRALSIPADDIRDKVDNGTLKPGLLDRHGTTMKPDLVEPTRKVLATLVEYFDADSPESDAIRAVNGGAEVLNTVTKQ